MAQAVATTTTTARRATMRALVQEGTGSADVLAIREVERPTLLPDRVLVRVKAASVNALDWHTVRGMPIMRVAAKVMRRTGHPVRGVDVAGYVEEVGSAVTRFKPGDAVFGTALGSFAEFARAREDRLVHKPDALTFEEAAALPVAGLTALQGVRDIAEVKAGQRVLVYGAGGGVGTMTVQIAKALGAYVTAVTGPRNLELVRALGADEVIDSSQEDVTRRAERYDAVLDVAATRSLADLRRVLRPGGTLVLVGAAKRGGLAIFARVGAAYLRARALRQRVRFFVSQVNAADLAVLSGLAEDGTLRPAIDRTFPFPQAAEAIRYVGTGQARAKVVITL